jgi:uncharacterized protein (DUF697 family)
VVVVRGNRIVAVGRQGQVKVPEGAKIIDVRGKTVMPGLVDVHWHGQMGSDGILPEQSWVNYSSLSFGLTTLHDPSNATAEIFSASELGNLTNFLRSNAAGRPDAKIIGLVLHDTGRVAHPTPNGNTAPQISARSRLQSALQEKAEVKEHLLQVFELSFIPAGNTSGETKPDVQNFMSLLARELPNEARVEMARISRDRTAQIEIAQMLVKSTSAICAAIGAQPIPLADLPILTALQLVMVSGIMYIGGRERSLRAATEFVGALGVNVGAGMILREGTRALLKFFPGWGNVVCGAVAGAGTYAIGRASIVYFLEGLSLKDARRAYLSSRRKRSSVEPRPMKQIGAAR